MKLLQFTPKISLLVLAIMFAKMSYSQEHVKLINSQKVLKEGIELYDDEKYEKALDLFNTVPDGDTNYFSVQYEKALCYIKLENYDKAIDLSRKLIAEGTREISQYNLLGMALDALKKKDEALKTYNEALSKYPYNSSLLLNKGIVYEIAGDFKNAFETYKELLNVSPMYPSAHLHLAQMAEKEGKLTQAIMAYTFFLILEPTGSRSNTVLGELNRLCNKSSNNVGTSNTGVFDNEFEDLDFLINNQVALNDKYKVPGKLKYPINKQLYLVLEKTASLKQESNGYFSKYYLPFFSDFLKNQSYEDLSLLMVASSDIEDIAKMVKKKIDNLKKSRDIYMQKISDIRPKKDIEINGEKLSLSYWNYSDFSLEALGNRNSLGKNVGTWLSFGKSGFIDMIGAFDEKGNRDGRWIYFNLTGDTAKVVTYESGIANGLYRIYRNGLLDEEGFYRNDMISGEIKEYYPDGKLKMKDVFLNDKRNGSGTQYFANGNIKFEYTSQNGELTGLFKEFYSHGAIKQEATYKNGKYDGPYKEYYENGKVRLDCKYINNQLEGSYKRYYNNGAIEKEGMVLKGNMSGKWVEYYSDGKVKSISNMDEAGKINGEEIYFDHFGRKYAQDTYVKGDWKSSKYFDKQGKIISDKRISKGETKFVSYGFQFDKVAEGSFVGGEREGEWLFYWPSGQVSTSERYSKGKLTGESKSFFIDGKPSVTHTYIDDKKDGLELKYYSNGVLSSEGNYIDGNKNGIWKTYGVNGVIEDEYFYNEGELNGWGYEYFTNGKINKKYKYKNGNLEIIIHCDTNGMAIDSTTIKNGTGRAVLKGASGSKGYDGGFLDGNMHGPITWYYGDNQVWIKANYHMGYKNGEYLNYHPNGKLKSKNTYFYGDLEGKTEFYNFFGELTQTEEYKNGQNHGSNTFYYKGGAKECEIEFYEDQKHNLSRYYAPSGELREQRFYEYGKLIGYTYTGKNGKLVDTTFTSTGDAHVKAYYANGNLSTEYEIKSGKYDGSYKIFYPNGKLQEERLYISGSESKQTKEYFNNGNIQRVISYEAGDYHGDMIEYNQNGTIRMKEHYVNGNLDGVCEYFDANGKRIAAYVYLSGEFISSIK